MAFTNPLGYNDSRGLRDSSKHECTGMCERCPNSGFCPTSRLRRASSGYRNSGDDKFNSIMLDAFAFRSSSRYTGSNSNGGGGFQNPMYGGFKALARNPTL